MPARTVRASDARRSTTQLAAMLTLGLLRLFAACTLPSSALITTASSSPESEVSTAGVASGVAGAPAATAPEPAPSNSRSPAPDTTPPDPNVKLPPGVPTTASDAFTASDALIKSIIGLPEITQPALEVLLGVPLLHDANYPPESLRYVARMERGPFESAQVNLPNPQLAEPRVLTTVLLNVRADVDIQLRQYTEAGIIVADGLNAGMPPSEPFVTYRVEYLPQHQVGYRFASDSRRLASALVEYMH